mmetsp:Transcript_24762/g.69356  ORF Transcript_24762/g.69356 Transcript_24762/m.69356 type:complete len:88 (+) Transcript_24762:837-1100(+)
MHNQEYLRMLSLDETDIKGSGGRACEFYLIKHNSKATKKEKIYSLESFVFPDSFVSFYEDGKPMAARLAQPLSIATQFRIEPRKKSH